MTELKISFEKCVEVMNGLKGDISRSSQTRDMLQEDKHKVRIEKIVIIEYN